MHSFLKFLPKFFQNYLYYLIPKKAYTICFSCFQNILELKVCDEDNVTQDDHLLTVFFDVSKIQLGENIQLSFQLNPQVWINFKDKAKRTWLGENVFFSAFLSPVWYIPLSYCPFSQLSITHLFQRLLKALVPAITVNLGCYFCR